MNNIYPSALVESVAGRDKGRIFVVLSHIDENHVFVSDGKMRRVEKPKKKKIKHLRLLGQHSEFLESKMTEDGRVTNSDIRKELARLSEDQENN